jgi:predicted phage-related endonuclease
MGCTLDFDVLDHEWGPGIVETKVIFEYGAYAEHWSNDRAPPEYELQVQHQLAVTGLPWCACVPWVAQTATLAPALVRRPNAGVIAEIETRVAAFWQSIRDGKPPDPTGTAAEIAIMRELWPARAEKKIVDLPDVKLAEEAQLLIWAGEQRAGMQRQYDASRARLLGAARDAELLRLPGYDVAIRQDKRGHLTIAARENAGNGVLPAAAGQSTIMSG